LEPSGPVQACNGIAFHSPPLKRQSLFVAKKLQIYFVLIRPLIKYGAETWTLKEDFDKRLAIFEGKILGRIW